MLPLDFALSYSLLFTLLLDDVLLFIVPGVAFGHWILLCLFTVLPLPFAAFDLSVCCSFTFGLLAIFHATFDLCFLVCCSSFVLRL
jgi:hypothetical protein